MFAILSYRILRGIILVSRHVLSKCILFEKTRRNVKYGTFEPLVRFPLSFVGDLWGRSIQGTLHKLPYKTFVPTFFFVHSYCWKRNENYHEIIPSRNFFDSESSSWMPCFSLLIIVLLFQKAVMNRIFEIDIAILITITWYLQEFFFLETTLWYQLC